MIALDKDEMELALRALRHTAEYEYSVYPFEDDEEYKAMKKLIKKLDPTPVKKEGWIVRSDESEDEYLGVYTDEEVAKWKEPRGDMFRVTWEE